MIKFLKLTEIGGNDATRAIFINVAWIKSFQLSNKGKDTMIFMHDKSFYFVKESVDNIWSMININTT